MFGPSKEVVWRELNGEVEGRFVEGGFFKGTSKVEVNCGQWTIVLDTYTVSNGKTSTTYTRLRAPFVNKDGFRFTVYRKSIFSGLGKKLGMQDVEIGWPTFDEDFIIKGNDDYKLRQLFAPVEIRKLIDEQRHIHLEIRDDEGCFGKKFPEGVDELYFQTYGVIKDIDRLKGLFDLFSEVLNRLCHIGSAYEDDPGVDLGSK